MGKDTLYKDASIGGAPFVFNRDVVAVFPDMIRRSVPGYATTLDAIGRLAADHLVDGSRGYDLGCSLGAALLAMRAGSRASRAGLTGIDNSPAMIERCRELVEAAGPGLPVELIEGDVCEAEIADAGIVVLNYTLQFVAPDRRDALLARIRAGMRPDGVLLISEKIHIDDPVVAEAIVSQHEAFKEANGYSRLEIARKRTALENVLVPDTLGHLQSRLESAGFARSGVWLQQFNFVSLLAYP